VEVSEQGAAQAARENPTASYEHCLMRVRTMTEKGLSNRAKSIERAAGKHSVIKMAIFKSCLQDQGLWDLAEIASKALERLKALKAPIEDE
jgi:RNA-binding protein YhbY